MPTQKQITDNMIQQLRILDPSISAEIGTPERKIIETVAQAIAETQVDLNVLNGAFDVNAKFGADLDNMLALLGFGRQSGSKATGYVTFSRETAATAPIVIKMGTTVFTPTGGDGGTSVVFRLTTTVAIPIGAKSVVAPIEAIQSGSMGNVAANAITETVGTPVYGITSVTNDYPTTGGTDVESDSEMKARFTTAGAFRNLAGTYDQYMALALSTISKKAIVVGPISKYQEYLQVPSQPDVEGGLEFTTDLSNNVNSKHIYENSPYFIVNDSGVAQVYYNPGSDFLLNVTPTTKNRGDALRHAEIEDPASTDAPTIYKPNVTFTNVYTGLTSTKPDEAISPEDVLLFEHSYMSLASRNDYDRNILNCVDVYVDGSDTKSASATISRPGVNVPTFKFSSDKYSAFYIDNYRRVNDPSHRPVVGNVFTPLYKQPITELPNQISLSNGTFIKDVHYWLVEETTDLYGTVRARNGIEWSSTIPAKTNANLTNGPFTGPYIVDKTVSSTVLNQDLPSSSVTSVSTGSTVTPWQYTVTNKKLLASNVAQLTLSATPDISVNDLISVTGVSGFNGSAIKVTAVGSTTINYANPNTQPVYTVTNKVIASSVGTLTLSTTPDIATGDSITVAGVDSTFNGTYTVTAVDTGAKTVSFARTGTQASASATGTVTLAFYGSARASTGNVVLNTIDAASTTPIQVTSTTGFPSSGHILIGSEILSYSSNDSDTFVISGRGKFGTKAAAITTLNNTVKLLVNTKGTTGLPTTDYLRIGTEQMNYTLASVGTSSTLVQILQRGSNGSYVSSHSVDDVIDVLFTTVDQSVSVADYQYDENIPTLQSILETNKQVTTDVLAHKAKVRYFKPDVTIMYSPGSNKTGVDEGIRLALTSYFNSLYFGSEIQMSDLLQTIHNVGGVDNVRWSRDGLIEAGQDYDSNGNSRPRLVETNQYGDPIGAPVLDKVRIGDGTLPTEYRFYLPYVPGSLDYGTLSAPTSLTISDDYPTSVISTFTTTAATATIVCDSNAGMVAGMKVFGTGIASGTTISSVNVDGVTIVLSAAKSATTGTQSIQAVKSDSPSYINTGSTYYYVVTATNNRGETIASSSVSDSTTRNYGAFSLDWDAVPGATGYKVYRNTSANSFTTGSKLIATLGEDDGTSFYDLGTSENPQLPGVPPTTNTAEINNFNVNPLSFFNIQYGQNAPIAIQYDDFTIDVYDADKSYTEGDIVLYGSVYYRSLLSENQGHDPSDDASAPYWILDTVNTIGFQSKINDHGNNNIVTVTKTNGYRTGPSFDNPLTIKYINKSSTEELQITNSIVNSGSGVFEKDFQIGDNELGSLPVGQLDGNGSLILSTVITIRAKSQNTWGSAT